MSRYIVAGVGTDVGKTVVSAVVVKATGAAYWKPIQTGAPSDADREAMAQMVPGLTLHPERHNYPTPMSPHAAAALEDEHISLNDFECPVGPVIVELAGGILVPFNDTHTNLDLIKKLGLPVLLVSRYYLGSINHTLLTIAMLKQHEVPIAGLILNGNHVASSHEAIVAHGGVPILLDLPELPNLQPETIAIQANNLHL